MRKIVSVTALVALSSVVAFCITYYVTGDTYIAARNASRAAGLYMAVAGLVLVFKIIKAKDRSDLSVQKQLLICLAILPVRLLALYCWCWLSVY